MFRHTVDHPGFDWASLGAPSELVVHYLFSMTAEQDPVRRQAKLREYREDFQRKFPRA